MYLRYALIAPLAALAAAAGDGFVPIPAGLAVPGSPASRLEAFELSVHPVTNAEYKLFVDDSRQAPPLHWEGGHIPAGMDAHPVVFVNRYDVAEYLAWLTARTGRVHRLPTAAEFEYAACGGRPGVRYPWGDKASVANANYDPSGRRTFAEWRKYLAPAAGGAPNPYGLYGMAGNVWQMVDSLPDPATARFKYRIGQPADLENGLAGGSWARSEAYLRCGVRGGASPGIRHPDIGFRVAREPAGTTHFRRQPRRLIAAAAGGGAVYLGWQWLPDDAEGTGFHVYRATRRDVAGERITPAPVRDSTSYLDRAPGTGRVYYRVRAVAPGGAEGPPSEWTGVEPGARNNVIATFEATATQGGVVPVFGDLDGDGRLDAVLRLDNGIREMSRDPGVPVELEAFTADGRALWRRPLVFHDHCFGSANNVPVTVWDLDGDGRSEVIARLQEGDNVFLAVLDGMTGRVLRKTLWTPMVSDFSKSSTRIHMAIAYLDGRSPAIITQTGLYENEVYDAFDARLNKLWQFRSVAETSGSGSHHIDVADVDGDGRDEVFDGTTLLNPDGTLRWSIYREHPDIVAVKRILPGSKGRQVYYAVESSMHAGAYLVDAATGRVLWKVNREDDPRWQHAHVGWASDIWEGSPGMELLTNRDGHTGNDLVLFGSEGKVLANPFPKGWRPVNWTGGAVRELMNSTATALGRFDGKAVLPVAGVPPREAAQGGCNMTADLAGDYRDEIVCVAGGKVTVLANLDPPAGRAVTRTASREYRLWLARNMGAGYASYFEWEP